MNIEDYREYCLSKPGTSESFPFDEHVLVFKVGGKMFALTNVDDYKSVNLKCDPEWALELRESHAGVHPGYHMSKKHWNTVEVFADLDEELLKKLIDHSYDLVLSGLPKKEREAILNEVV